MLLPRALRIRGEDAPVTEPDVPHLEQQLGDDSGGEEALEDWAEGGA